MSSEVTLRPATAADLPVIADLYIRVREAAVPDMPPGIHPPHEVHAYVAGWNLDEREVWVAEDDRVVAFSTLTPTWLDSLYVDPSAQGSGIGSALLDVAKARRPDGFALWVFESNRPAREFYRRHGLVELERTDGSTNEEKEPDLRMAWLGEEPLTFLRSCIDDVDQELAHLLARRVALTAAVQNHKAVPGPAGRDADREREIAEKMAHHAPVLGADRLGRIIRAIITESLDAYQDARPPE